MAVINDEQPGSEKMLTNEIAKDAFNAMRLLPQEESKAFETTLGFCCA